MTLPITFKICNRKFQKCTQNMSPKRHKSLTRDTLNRKFQKRIQKMSWKKHMSFDS